MSHKASHDLLTEDLYLARGGAIHAAHEAIVTIDEAHRIVMINPAAERMFGHSAAEVQGQDLALLLPTRLRASHANHVRDFAASGLHEKAMGTRSTVLGLRANGEEFPAAATISKTEMSDIQGTRRLYTALLRDLSVETALRDELDGLRSRFQRLFDLAPVAVWIAEGEQIVFANQACLRLLGVAKPKDLLGKSIYSLLTPGSKAAVQGEISKALHGGSQVGLLAEKMIRPDGAEREVEIAVAALPGTEHATVQMVISDVTARVEEREDLRRLSANVVDAREEERKRIARELHDELGQRLSAIRMEVARLCGPSGPESDARLTDTLAMIDDTVASVRRIAAGLRPLMLDDLGLNAAIEWLARDSAARMGIEVTVRLDDDEPVVGHGIATALYRMVQESLSNVARHARASDVRITLRRDGDSLQLVIEDNGIGFPREPRRKPDAFGLLGMRERALLLGGSFKVDNVKGGGARLTIRLPLQVTAQAAARP